MARNKAKQSVQEETGYKPYDPYKDYVAPGIEYAKEALKLWAFAAKPRKTPTQKAELIARMRMMDTTWPGRGWTQEADKLQARLDSNGVKV